MTTPARARVGLVGAGKMGGALLRGWLADGWGEALSVLDPAPSNHLRASAAEYGFKLTTNPEGLTSPDVLVLAIKPQMLEAAAPGLAALCRPDTLLVSIMAGKTVADLAGRLPARAVIRAMPNTPAAVGQGITGAFAGAQVSAAQRTLAAELLGCVGAVEWLDREDLIDAVTAVSGSGPAYVFLLVEALAEAAQAVGLDPAQAMRFARATVEGASGLMAAEPGVPASQLRRDVTSPGGTTAAALAVLMADEGLGALMERAVIAARDRARALAG